MWHIVARYLFLKNLFSEGKSCYHADDERNRLQAIEGGIMPIRIRFRDKMAASIQCIDISRIMVIGRGDAMVFYTDRNPNLRILCGSI
jgi:hypothetical protein